MKVYLLESVDPVARKYRIVKLALKAASLRKAADMADETLGRHSAPAEHYRYLRSKALRILYRHKAGGSRKKGDGEWNANIKRVERSWLNTAKSGLRVGNKLRRIFNKGK